LFRFFERIRLFVLRFLQAGSAAEVALDFLAIMHVYENNLQDHLKDDLLRLTAELSQARSECTRVGESLIKKSELEDKVCGYTASSQFLDSNKPYQLSFFQGLLV
jgi:hypothetical protein